MLGGRPSTRRPAPWVRPRSEEAFRLDAGIKVVVLERRGDAVRVRVHTGSKLSGRERGRRPGRPASGRAAVAFGPNPKPPSDR